MYFLYLISFVLTTLVSTLIIYYKWKHKYWSKKNLPHLQPTIPFGTMERSFSRKVFLSQWIKQNYDELKAKGYKHGGLYNFSNPIYLPIHPEYIRNVMLKDFNHFESRGIYYNEKDDPLSANLIALGGQKWRTVRTKLTPVFTPGKLKSMVDIFIKCSEPMLEQVMQFSRLNEPIDVKEVTAKLATDILGSCLAGLDCNSFKNPDAEFRRYGKRMVKRKNFQALSSLLFLSIPQLGRLLKRREYAKDITDFFLNAIRHAVNFRKTNQVVRKDILQILIDEMEESSTNKFTIEEVAAHSFAFFIAGFETSSSTITFALLELSLNVNVQEKLREEITNVLKENNTEVSYDTVMGMPYLHQVLEETLRKYPIVAHITRKCVKDYKVPGTDVTIEAGTGVFISPLGVHNDPEFYPNPEKFDPERFNEENKKQRTPFTYIPFGEGPRTCIGLRFAFIEIKVALVMLLSHFKFSLNEKTQLPIKPDPLAFGYTPQQSLWLNVEKI